LPIWGALPGC